MFSIFFAFALCEYILSFSINLDNICTLDTLTYSKNIVNANNSYLVTSNKEKLELQIPYTDIRLDDKDQFYKNGFRYTGGNQKSKQGYVFLGCSLLLAML